MEKMKNLSGLGRTAALLVGVLLFLPTFWLVSNFIKVFWYDTEVVYSHFWLAMSLVTILFGGALTSNKEVEHKQRQKEEKDTVVVEMTLGARIRRIDEEKILWRRIAALATIRSAWTLLVVIPLRLFSNIPKGFFWIGLAILIVFNIVEIVRGWLSKNEIFFLPSMILTLASSAYRSFFWMIFAWAFGWGAFVAWSIVNLLFVAIGGWASIRELRETYEKADCSRDAKDIN